MDPAMARLESLTPQQRMLLNHLLAQRAPQQATEQAQGTSSRQVVRQARTKNDNVFPLSFAQERLWVLHQLNPDSDAYNLALAIRLAGNVSLSGLQTGLDQLVAEQEILRTVFREERGEPCQLVRTASAIQAQEIQLSGGDAELQACCQHHKRQLFNLADGPLLRVVLIRCADSQSVLLLVMHHIISDASSIRLCAERLLAHGRLHGNALPDTQALSIHYGDYAHDQRSRHAQSGPASADLDFWLHKLSGAPLVLEFPCDKSRPPEQTFAGALHRFTLPPALYQKLCAYDGVPGCTLFMKLLALFHALLFRHTQQSDLLIGAPVSGRNTSQTESLIGLFLNTLVFRARLDDACTFDSLLAQVKTDALGSFAHQELPFELLVQHLQVERDLSRNPVFQVALNVNTQAHAFGAGTDTQAEVLPLSGHTSLFDLTLAMRLRNGEPAFWFEYNTDLFDSKTIERLAQRFICLVESALAAPAAPIATLDCLPADEKRLLLDTLNNTQRSYAIERSTWELLAPALARAPSGFALITDDQQIDYASLQTSVARFARHLQDTGVRHGDAVGLYMEKSSNTVIALLAILQCGAYFIPLDPSYPHERLSFVVSNSAVNVIVTDRCAQLPWAGLRHIDFTRDAAAISACPATLTPCPAQAGDTAYCIYTSGSTGQPKGVRVPHRALVNFLQAMAEYPFITSGQKLLSVTPLSFDISILELLLPLFHSASVVLLPQSKAADPLALLAAIRKHRPDTMQATPATWQMLLEVGFDGEMADMTLLCGGEAFPVDLATRLSQRAHAVWNMYGPTETTIWSCVHKVESPAAGQAIQAVPVGTPIGNTTLYLLDNKRQLVPFGATGDLYIGGAGVAQGYHARDALTAERFIPDPFAPPPARLYNTGDLARLRPDGLLEYVGRSDFQVKVRGFRIELGEIETCLERHPDVQQAVVVVSGSNAENKRLVAHLRMRPGSDFSASALREFAAGHLPAYMLPNVLRPHASYPLTPNGKIDRKALQQESSTFEQELPLPTAPRTTTEHTLLTIWCEVLGKAQLGIHDNFFLNGGHSMAAIRIVAQIRERMGYEMSLKDFFQNVTIETQATLIDTASITNTHDHATDIEPDAEVAALVKAIWAETLKREDIQPDDDFFALGGHSMLAVKILARVRDCFDIEMSLQEVFTAPTVRQFAQRLTARLLEELSLSP